MERDLAWGRCFPHTCKPAPTRPQGLTGDQDRGRAGGRCYAEPQLRSGLSVLLRRLALGYGAAVPQRRAGTLCVSAPGQGQGTGHHAEYLCEAGLLERAQPVCNYPNSLCPMPSITSLPSLPTAHPWHVGMTRQASSPPCRPGACHCHRGAAGSLDCSWKCGTRMP